ncbi:hypothetical protein VTO73DRAFT_12831 [Trametes versicolor]
MPATRTQRQRRKAPTPIEIPTPAAFSAAVTPTDTPETHIKRPSNCFILFRSAHHADVKAKHASNRENELSGILSRMWTDAPESEKKIWKDAAKAVAEKHKEMFPDYTFQPQRKPKLEDADQPASDENAADLVKPKVAAKKRSTGRAPRGRKAAAQAAVPALEPTQVAAPSRASTRRTRKVQTSTAGPSAPVAGPSRLAPGSGPVLLASGASPLSYSDVEWTATVFLPAPVPGYPQPMAPSFPASLNANSVSALAQRPPWSQVLGGDISPTATTASSSLSKGFDLRHLSREWVGRPPRFIDQEFPAHLPIAGTVGPIDLEDAMFALHCVQSGISEAWVAPPPQMDAGVDISSPGFSSAPYDYPTPNGDDMLAPAINENAVLHATDQTAVNAAPSCMFEYVLDSTSQEPIAFAEPRPYQPPSPYQTEPVDYAPAPPASTITDTSQLSAGGEADPQRFGDTFQELDELLQSIGIPMGSMEPSL